MSNFDLAAEIAECETFITQAKTGGVKAVLKNHLQILRARESSSVAIAEPVAGGGSVRPPEVSVKPMGASRINFVPITDYSWDQGEYNTPNVSIFVDLPGVGAIKDKVDCKFGKHSIDLTVHDLDGKNYRLINENLEKDIVPAEGRVIVKANKIVIKLTKVKGQYSYENWAQLTAKKPRDEVAEKQKSSDPAGGIMDMMKDLYETGDDNMKKIIGEAMLKSQRGEKGEPPKFDDM